MSPPAPITATGAWAVVVEWGDFPLELERLALALEPAGRIVLHEWMVIQAQGWVFRNWPTKPSLHPLTLASKRGGGSGAVLIDSGSLRLSVAGGSSRPALGISTAPGSLNRAMSDYGQIGTSLLYAPIHQWGGTIRPVRAKNLAIPATVEAGRFRSPREFPRPLGWIPSKKPGVGGVLVDFGPGPRSMRGRLKRGTIQYILKQKVVIPARPFLPIDSVPASFVKEQEKVVIAFLTHAIRQGVPRLGQGGG